MVNFFIEIGILDSDPDLMAQGDAGLEVAVLKEPIMRSINRLKYTQEAPVGSDWNADHVPGDKSAGLIGLAKEPGVALNVIDYQRLSGVRSMAGDALAEPKLDLPNFSALFSMMTGKLYFDLAHVQH